MIFAKYSTIPRWSRIDPFRTHLLRRKYFVHHQVLGNLRQFVCLQASARALAMSSCLRYVPACVVRMNLRLLRWFSSFRRTREWLLFSSSSQLLRSLILNPSLSCAVGPVSRPSTSRRLLCKRFLRFLKNLRRDSSFSPSSASVLCLVPVSSFQCVSRCFQNSFVKMKLNKYWKKKIELAQFSEYYFYPIKFKKRKKKKKYFLSFFYLWWLKYNNSFVFLTWWYLL